MTAQPNDPTRAGFVPPASGAVLLSCGEVEALCLKAARGAGLGWGLAEEAGFAARWLHARRIDGPRALLARLDAAPGAAPPAACAGGRLGGPGPLCPIATGAALSDFAALFPRLSAAGPVIRPLFVLPFVHQIAVARECAMALAWRGGRVEVDPSGRIAGALAELAATEAADLQVEAASGRLSPGPAERGAWPAGAETIDRLNACAMLTTVPATAASRADAGAGVTDND